MSRRAGRPVALLLGLLLPVVLSACGYSGSHAAQVRQWAEQNSYLANAKQVAQDASRLKLAADTGSAAQLRTVGGGLSSDAGTLYGTLVTPDRKLTHELAKSMEDFFHAAETCAVARSTRTAAIRRAIVRSEAGLAELVVADRRLESFGFHSSAFARIARQ